MATVLHILDPATGYRATGDLAEVPALLARKDLTVWIDADEHGPVVRDLLLEQLQIHPLVVEDIFSDRITPKVEEYETFLYIVMHGVHSDESPDETLTTIELDVVIGDNWVFTHHTQPMPTIDDLHAELKRNPRPLMRGPAWIAHSLIDHLTDYYLPVVDRFDDKIADLEKDVVERMAPDTVTRIFTLRRSIQHLRRLSVHQRDTLARLSRGEFERIPDAARPFYRDVFDHFVRIADLADSYRELLTSALETYMSVTANRTNEIMKVLAIISTIMLPLTFVAGLYGMNFDHMPELHWHYGYGFALGLMAAIAASFMWFFRRRGWIGPPSGIR
ncbi:MAG: magnesium/cobalt transporter CorA [Deltaproteobacteria bacterium]